MLLGTNVIAISFAPTGPSIDFANQSLFIVSCFKFALLSTRPSIAFANASTQPLLLLLLLLLP
jgi:hypothetical protein